MRRRAAFDCTGVSVSIQTNSYTYCWPRNDIGPWVKVELGFPTKCPPRAILDYSGDDTDPTRTVYGYVPVDLVVLWLMDEGATKDDLVRFGFHETMDGVILV